MIKLKDILFEGKLSKSQIKKMRKDFDKTGKLPPHLKKLADLMDKEKKVKDIVIPGLEWMADIKEEKLTEASTSESYGQMLRLFKNAIPMIFRPEEGKLQKKYHDLVMNNGDVNGFLQAISVGDPKAMKLWPKVSKVIKKSMDNYYKEDIMIKQKLNTERNKMWMLLGKYGKKLKV